MKDHDYVCNGCGSLTSREDLIVKKVLFTGMGQGANTIKGRVVSWLCERCVFKDTDWNREPNVQPSERIVRKVELID